MKTIRSILDPLIDRALGAKRRRKGAAVAPEDTQLRLLDHLAESIDGQRRLWFECLS